MSKGKDTRKGSKQAWRSVLSAERKPIPRLLFDNDHAGCQHVRNNRAFRWVMDKLDKLAGFANDHHTDAEYRRMAEDIVRGEQWFDIAAAQASGIRGTETN